MGRREVRYDVEIWWDGVINIQKVILESTLD